MDNNLSVRLKINLALGIIFFVMLIVSVSIAVSAEKQLSQEMIEERLQEKAEGYLDTLNMLMISGAIGNRELVREKILADNNIIEARVIRAPSIDEYYQRGYDHEYPVDELDQRALNGEEILIEYKDNGSHSITYLMPVLAYKDYRGTNCLNCHITEENSVLGAIRISYSLDSLNQHIFSNMLKMSLVQAAMFVAALVLLGLMLRKLVIRPLQSVHRTLSAIERDSDLTVKATASSKDEIGATAHALNTMTDRFSGSLKQVVNLAQQLEDSASAIDDSSRASLHSAQQQNNETLNIQHSIANLRDSTEQVMNHVQESNQASNEAKEVASQGVEKTTLASQSITTMNEAIQSAAAVIATLDERSNNVGSVLEAIRGVADQTNLLALNAAIEAARAGESGRGFAVVADEVRTLSQRTAESTEEIEHMLKQLQEEASRAVHSMNNAQSTSNEGMQRVQEAAEALYSMANHVERMSQLNQETLHNMQRQVEISESVNQGVESISAHSANSTHSANNTAEVAKQLVAVANELSQLVGRFRV